MRTQDLGMPHSIEAERIVIGIIILKNERYEIVRSVLGVNDFYDHVHRICYGAIEKIMEDGGTVDQVTIWEILKKKRNDKAAMELLGNICHDIVTTVNISHYVNIVKENSSIRELIYKAREIERKAMSYTSIDQVTDMVDGIVDISRNILSSNLPTSMFDLRDKFLAEYSAVSRGEKGIPYPWETMNNITNGMLIGKTTLFVARPSIGKTFTLVLLAHYAWKNGYPVLIVSPEMDKLDIAERFFPIETDVSYSRVAYGKLSDMEFPKLESGIRRLDGCGNLWIMDASDDITAPGIEAAVRATGAKLVVLDSIYKLRFRGERRDRAVAAIEWLMPAAKRLKFSGVGFTQLNRDAEKSAKMGGGSRLGTIGLGDELGQDPDFIFSLDQTKDEKKDKIVRIKPLKLRKGYWGGEPLSVNWDWIDMKYDEIPVEEEPFVDDPVQAF